MIHAVDVATGQSIAGAAVSVVPVSPSRADPGGVTGITRASGYSPAYQFPVPASSTAAGPGTVYWGSIDVTVSAAGYETFEDHGVKVLDQQIGAEEALMVPGSGTFTANSPAPTPSYRNRADAPAFSAENAGSGTIPSTATATPQAPCCGTYTQPANITVHFGAPSCYTCANVTYSFSDYTKHALVGEWIPSWGNSGGMVALNFGAIAVRTFANYDIYRCRWRCAERNFDITTDPNYNQSWSDTTYANTDAAVANTPHMNFEAPGMDPYGPVNNQYRAYTGCISSDEGEPYLPSITDQVQCDHGIGNYIGPGASQWGTYWWASGYGKTKDWMTTHYYTVRTGIYQI